MTVHGIEIPEGEVAEFCRRNHIRRLALFGSIVRDDFRPGSDVDVLVEVESGQPKGLLRLAELELELSDLLGHRVDLRTAGCLSPYFREEALEEARTLYVAP
jgi:hypothetical protein